MAAANEGQSGTRCEISSACIKNNRVAHCIIKKASKTDRRAAPRTVKASPSTATYLRAHGRRHVHRRVQQDQRVDAVRACKKGQKAVGWGAKQLVEGRNTNPCPSSSGGAADRWMRFLNGLAADW